MQARLAQSVERKALNLVVVGSSPTVGVIVLQWVRKGRRYSNCERGTQLLMSRIEAC